MTIEEAIIEVKKHLTNKVELDSAKPFQYVSLIDLATEFGQAGIVPSASGFDVVPTARWVLLYETTGTSVYFGTKDDADKFTAMNKAQTNVSTPPEMPSGPTPPSST